MIYFRIAVATIDTLLAGAMLYVLFLAMTSPAAASSPSRARAGMGNILIAIAGLILLGSGSLKFAHVPQVVDEMTSLSLAGWKLNLVAALEVLSGLLFLWRRSRSLGLLVASAYLGAAICAHVQSDQYFAVLPTMVVLGCCWLGAALRHPQILWSLAERGDASAAPDPRAFQPVQGRPAA